MSFADRLREQRVSKGLTQQALAAAAGVQALQIRRYESGKSQPMLDVLHRLCVALSCSADLLVFGAAQRGPAGQSLRDQLAMLEQLPVDARAGISETLSALINWQLQKK